MSQKSEQSAASFAEGRLAGHAALPKRQQNRALNGPQVFGHPATKQARGNPARLLPKQLGPPVAAAPAADLALAKRLS